MLLPQRGLWTLAMRLLWWLLLEVADAQAYTAGLGIHSAAVEAHPQRSG